MKKEAHPDFKSPKKLRAGSRGGHTEARHGEGMLGSGTREEDLSPPQLGAPFEAVAETAQAFRQLRMRVPMGGVEHGGGSSLAALRGASSGQQPRSPKKRKATTRIDKEFILKDDKVKRNTDQQGDISQARGMLGALLFEFGQLELNRDLLEAIRRTESRTGRQNRSARSGADRAQQDMDRLAFEYSILEAGELLHSHLATLAAHTEDTAQQRAMLRAYAVQAIATFADEDDSSEDEDGFDGEAASDRSPSPQRYPNDGLLEGALEIEGESEQEEGEGESEGEGEGRSPGKRSPRWRSPSVDMMRAGSATPLPARQEAAAQRAHQQAQAQGSASETVSSSILPDAPPEAALEDTATMSGAARQQDALGVGEGAPTAEGPAEVQREVLGRGREGSAAAGPVHLAQQQQRRQQLGGRPAEIRGGGGEGSGPPSTQTPPAMAQSSGLGDDVMQQLSDAVDEMLRSPEAVSSRPRQHPTWGALSSYSPAPSQPASQDSDSRPAPIPPAPGSLAEVQQLLWPRGQGLLQQQLQQQAVGGGVYVKEQQQQQGPGPLAGQGPVQQPPQQQQQPQQQSGAGPASHPAQPHAHFHAHPHPHQRLHAHSHRQLRAHRREGTAQHPLPSLTEEGGYPMEGGEGLGGAAGAKDAGLGSGAARPPLHALELQQQQLQQQEASSGSGGTQQSGAAVLSEAPKRQRTDMAADEVTGALQILAQRVQRDAQQPQQHWVQHSPPQHGQLEPGPSRQLIKVRANASHLEVHAQEATSPLHEQQHSPAALQQAQQQSPADRASPLVTSPGGAQQQQKQLVGGPEAAPAAAAIPAAAAAAAVAAAAAQEQLHEQPGDGGPGPAGKAHEESIEARGVAPGTGSSAWGSSLVCADLTVNDVASKYWPFLRSAMQGQGATLREDDTALVAALVRSLGEAIASAYLHESGGRRPAPETKSLIAATVFDDMFRETLGQESSQGGSK